MDALAVARRQQRIALNALERNAAEPPPRRYVKQTTTTLVAIPFRGPMTAQLALPTRDRQQPYS